MLYARIRNRLKREMQKRRDSKLTPARPRSGDFYLVEFPRSGITWLSLLIANALLSQSGLTGRATFSSISNYVPDLFVNTSTDSFKFPKSGIGIYKSHDIFNCNYIHTIYLVRHPLSVMRSYHQYMSSFGYKVDSLESFCHSRDYGIERWKRHINSWLSPGQATKFLHLIRYEDLVANTQAELEQISENFGWNLGTADIASAVASASRDNMRQQEQLHRARNPSHTIELVGSGEITSEPALEQEINEI